MSTDPQADSPAEETRLQDLSDNSVLHLLPGDVLILSAQGKLSKDDRRYLADYIDRYFPHYQVLILEDGARLSAIRQQGNFPFPVGGLSEGD